MHINDKRDIQIGYDIDLSTTVFFDIETTGFSRNACQIYMIGAMTINASIADIHLFFAENKDEESSVITDFFEYLDQVNCTRLITFNGASFDIPFVEARAMKLGLSGLSFRKYDHLDIYKAISGFKPLLGLEKMGQKYIECFLGIGREDEMDGGQLIKVYQRYCKHPSEEDKHLLIIHNYEDVYGMAALLPILSYRDIFYSTTEIIDYEITDYISYEQSECVSLSKASQELIVTCKLKNSVPRALTYKNSDYDYYLKINADILKLRIPLYDGYFRYYYKDTNNYWYLPAEGIAIHKSVSNFTDKSSRIPATLGTCFTKAQCTDEFLNSPKFAQFIKHCLELLF